MGFVGNEKKIYAELNASTGEVSSARNVAAQVTEEPPPDDNDGPPPQARAGDRPPPVNVVVLPDNGSSSSPATKPASIAQPTTSVETGSSEPLPSPADAPSLPPPAVESHAARKASPAFRLQPRLPLHQQQQQQQQHASALGSNNGNAGASSSATSAACRGRKRRALNVPDEHHREKSINAKRTVCETPDSPVVMTLQGLTLQSPIARHPPSLSSSTESPLSFVGSTGGAPRNSCAFAKYSSPAGSSVQQHRRSGSNSSSGESSFRSFCPLPPRSSPTGSLQSGQSKCSGSAGATGGGRIASLTVLSSSQGNNGNSPPVKTPPPPPGAKLPPLRSMKPGPDSLFPSLDSPALRSSEPTTTNATTPPAAMWTSPPPSTVHCRTSSAGSAISTLQQHESATPVRSSSTFAAAAGAAAVASTVEFAMSTPASRTPLPRISLTPRSTNSRGSSRSGRRAPYPSFPSPTEQEERDMLITPRALFTLPDKNAPPPCTISTTATSLGGSSASSTNTQEEGRRNPQPRLGMETAPDGARRGALPQRSHGESFIPALYAGDRQQVAASTDQPQPSGASANSAPPLPSTSLLLPSPRGTSASSLWFPENAGHSFNVTADDCYESLSDDSSDEFVLAAPDVIAQEKQTKRRSSKQRKLCGGKSDQAGPQSRPSMTSLASSGQASSTSLLGMDFVSSSGNLNAMNGEDTKAGAAGHQSMRTSRPASGNNQMKRNESMDSMVGLALEAPSNGNMLEETTKEVKEHHQPSSRELMVTPPADRVQEAHSPPPLRPQQSQLSPVRSAGSNRSSNCGQEYLAVAAAAASTTSMVASKESPEHREASRRCLF